MHWKSTLLMILLAGAAVAWLWKGDEWAVAWGLRPAPVAAASAESVTILVDEITPDTVTRIELPTTNPAEPFTLTRAAGSSEWSLPGNWPLRKPVVDELVQALTSLRTRFVTTPLAVNADLTPYGLASTQHPLEVTVEAKGKPHTLRFGEAPLAEGENPFTRPTYLRIDDRPEVVRLGPDVLAVLRRPMEDYRRRQVFADTQRARLESDRPANPMGGPPPTPTVVPILADSVQAIEVIQPDTVLTVFGVPVSFQDGRYKLERAQPNPTPYSRAKKDLSPYLSKPQLAQAWTATEPVRTHVDPDRTRALLTALPELWADEFQQPEQKRRVLIEDIATALGGTPLLTLGLWATAPPTTGTLDSWFVARAGLEKPDRRIVLTRKGEGAGPIEVKIGAIARVKKPAEGASEEFRYAMLANNPVVFLLKTDRLNDIFVKAPTLRDSRLARFDAGEVEEVTITAPNQPPTKLMRTRGNPKAASEVEKADRWYLTRGNATVLADDARVNELLSLLATQDTPGAQQSFATATPAGTTVTIQAREAIEDGLPPPPLRTFTLVLAPVTVKDDMGKESVATYRVAEVGWPRVDTAKNDDDRVAKVIRREADTYRSLKLFDTATAKLDAVDVQGSAGESFALTKAGDAWTLTRPPAGSTDAAKATSLTDTLSQLEAVQFITDAPKPEDLAKYGLATPGLTVAITFKGENATQSRTLTIGSALDKPADDKPQVYARLDGGPVVTIPASVVDTLKDGSLALLPMLIFTPEIKTFTRLEVNRGMSGESYTLTPTSDGWELTGPFTARVSKPTITPSLSALGSLQALKYEALAATDPARFGFETPALRLGFQFLQSTPEGDRPASRTLLLGKPTEDGSARYAQVQGGSNAAVFTVPGTLLEILDRSALDLLDTKLLALDPRAITRITVAGPKPEDALTLVRNNGVWSAEGQGFTVDQSTAEQFARRLAGLSVYRIVGYGPQVKWSENGLEPADRTITITEANGATHTIAFGKKDMTGDRYTRVDGGPALAVVLAGDAASLTPARLEFVDRTLLQFQPGEFNGLARTKGTEEFEIEPGTTQGWAIVKPAKQKADAPLLEGVDGFDEPRGLIRTLAQLRASRIAAYGPREDLAKFGLDKPAAAITLKLGDKPTEKVLKIGNPVEAAKPEGDRYVMVESPGPNVAVGVLPGAVCKPLLAEPVFYRDRTLAKFLDADRLTLERGDRKVTFAKVMGTWKVLEPVRVDAEHSDLEEFVNALANLRADELVKEKADDLAPYGLDRPLAQWKVFNRGKEELSLLVGKTDNGRAFVKLEKQDTIGALAPRLTNRVLGEYRDRKVWKDVDAAQIVSVVVSGADRTFQFEKFGPGWDDPKSPMERISTAAVNDFLGALGGLTADHFVVDTKADLKLYGLDKPQRVIVLTQRSPMAGVSTKTLRLGAAEGGSDGKRVYALVEEPGRNDVVFVLNEAATERLLKDRAAFLEKKK